MGSRIDRTTNPRTEPLSRPHYERTKHAKWAIRALYGMAILSVAALLSTAAELNLLHDALNGVAISEERAASNDERQAIISLLWIGGYIVTAVLFVLWLRLAYDKALAVSPERIKYSKTWTIWGWVVPIVFLYIPYRIMKDTWRTLNGAWETSVPKIIPSWWATWLGMNILGQVSWRVLDMDDLSSIYTSSWTSFGSDILAIAAALFAAKLVARVDAKLPAGS